MKQELNNKFSFLGTEERIRKLINSLGVGVLLQGPGTEILFSNIAASKILGLTEDELYGRTSLHPEWNVVHENGSSFHPSTHPVSIAIKTKKPVLNVIMGVERPVTKDRVWLLVNAEPFLNNKGEVKEVICSFSDISEQKAVETKMMWLYQSLEIRALELATSNAELERFITVASHDLQEPLRLVSSFTQLLKIKYAKQLDKQANEYINYAAEGATRMKKLILDLLEYSKFSSNKEGFSPTDMNKVLRDASERFSNDLRDTGAKLIVTPLPVINANTSLMTQLFENLIGNALKYRNGNSPEIKIKCKEEKNNFLFSVCDNGIGIAPKYWEKIFLLFQRLHSDNGSNEGTGIGLAICKKIVGLHRGTIWVESEEGKGSTFYFTIAKDQNQVYEKV